MSVFGSLKGRSAVAPVLSIIAIVLSLGGVSYAALTLPGNSVGPKQLRAKAVRPKALAFPVGVAGITKADVGPVVRDGFCVPVDGVSPPCPAFAPNETVKLRVKAIRSGMLHLSGTVSLSGVGTAAHSEGRALARIGLKVNGAPAGPTWASTVEYGTRIVVPFDSVMPIRAGKHSITLVLDGVGQNYLNVDATSASLNAEIARSIAG